MNILQKNSLYIPPKHTPYLSGEYGVFDMTKTKFISFTHICLYKMLWYHLMYNMKNVFEMRSVLEKVM